MKLCFVETEPDERVYFEESFTLHEVSFEPDLESVPPEAEVVSVFVNSRVDEAFLRAHPALKLITTRSSAHDHISLAACHKRKVAVVNIPIYGAATVAEHTFALILAVARRLRACYESTRRGRLSQEKLRGLELRGKILGVVGVGRVGMQVIRIANGFGMKCLGFDARPNPVVAEALGFEYRNLDEVLGQADVVTLHVPLTKRTRHLIDRRRLEKMKPGVLLINTARGGLVDIEALLKGLESGQVGGVGLDVLEDEGVFTNEASGIIGAQIVAKIHAMSTPGGAGYRKEERMAELRSLMQNKQLLAHPNVFFTPHVGFNSVEAIERINVATVDLIRSFLTGELSAASCL